jgi:thioredoxin-related protein
MKTYILAFLFPFLLSATSPWLNDFNDAKNLSKEKDEYILLNFSGSDWCSGCIKMHKDIFGSTVFQEYAKDHLVLLNADFPRSKKNGLPADLQKKNNALADKYNTEGAFPLTVLLDSDGKVIKKWSGFYTKGPENFVNELKELDAHSNN